MRRLILCFCLLALGGCSWFNSIGEHMPVIGERCENWQCFTTSGQQASDAKKKMMQQPQPTPAAVPQAPAAAPVPSPAPAWSNPPTTYPTPGNPTGAYYQPAEVPPVAH